MKDPMPTQEQTQAGTPTLSALLLAYEAAAFAVGAANNERSKRALVEDLTDARARVVAHFTHPILQAMRAPQPGCVWKCIDPSSPNVLANWKEVPDSAALHTQTTAQAGVIAELVKVLEKTRGRIEELRHRPHPRRPNAMSETPLTDKAEREAHLFGLSKSQLEHVVKHARSLELNLRRSSESRERVEKALKRLINDLEGLAMAEHGCLQMAADYAPSIGEARSALHAASKEGQP